MGALYKLYNEDLKEYSKAQIYIEMLLNEVKGKDIQKTKDYQMKFIKILELNHETKKIVQQFEEIMLTSSSDIESVMFVAELLINLKLNLKEIDVSDPSKVSYFRMFSNKLQKLDLKDRVQPFEKLMNLII
jgi:hypothetical protein